MGMQATGNWEQALLRLEEARVHQIISEPYDLAARLIEKIMACRISDCKFGVFVKTN